eukprot:TRINITY_DN27392_c0_g1_i2.p1 TRINITY_DN27392_c0_g1~~TRINITY_DN27392_c0_g1_i2.p1  ORF type:complete len:109 (+),score=24.35 TRINITY_DN27392_c0_g1_i2:141-467(+)
MVRDADLVVAQIVESTRSLQIYIQPGAGPLDHVMTDRSVDVEGTLPRHHHLVPLTDDIKFVADSHRSGLSRDPGSARACLLYTSDAADEEDSVDLGGRRIIKKKKRLT